MTIVINPPENYFIIYFEITIIIVTFVLLNQNKMSKTKDINIFKTLKYPLTVKASKVVVPVYVHNLTIAEEIFILINTLQHKKLAPIETTKGYRQYLKQNKNNEEVLRKWWYGTLRNKGTEYQILIDQAWEYINLQELYDFSGTEIDVVKNFEKYLHYNVYDANSLNVFVNYYLRYLPFMTNAIPTPRIIEGSGYCCEDCDGGYSQYVKNQYEHEASMLQFKLRDSMTVEYKRNSNFGWGM